MLLGTEIGLGPGDVVLDGDPAAPKRGTPLPPPIFCTCLLWPNGWIDEDATWYGSRPRPRAHCVRRGPSSLRERDTAPPPLFRPCLLWPLSPISATAELLCSILPFLENGCIIRPHRSTTYVDAAYSYRPSSVVCRSVTLVSPAKTAAPIELPFG